MPFIAAGDPDLGTTQELIRVLADAGVDLIEVGFPYSDPIADGPVIQASYTRALDQGLKVNQIFDSVKDLTAQNDELPPLVAMVVPLVDAPIALLLLLSVPRSVVSPKPTSPPSMLLVLPSF